ncbi:macro domain-containing protein [Intrasporangium flavum]|uniref:macro domain-containing protein n=1 Tax=Intrasporangium flavum TaxID=1428657 RepID=UPI00096D516B|nr:macro domain-containing protein [Intrasporangium flavum]
MAYTELTGDLLTVDLPAIGHGCNTAGSMAGGIARQVRDRWPQLYAEYAQRCATGRFALGSFHAVDVGDKLVYNLGTQARPGRNADLDAIESAVSAVLDDLTRRGIPALGLPRLGAGIGGLPWREVEASLRRMAMDSPVQLVVVTQPRRGNTHEDLQ